MLGSEDDAESASADLSGGETASPVKSTSTRAESTSTAYDEHTLNYIEHSYLTTLAEDDSWTRLVEEPDIDTIVSSSKREIEVTEEGIQTNPIGPENEENEKEVFQEEEVQETQDGDSPVGDDVGHQHGAEGIVETGIGIGAEGSIETGYGIVAEVADEGDVEGEGAVKVEGKDLGGKEEGQIADVMEGKTIVSITEHYFRSSMLKEKPSTSTPTTTTAASSGYSSEASLRSQVSSPNDNPDDNSNDNPDSVP